MQSLNLKYNEKSKIKFISRVIILKIRSLLSQFDYGQEFIVVFVVVV